MFKEEKKVEYIELIYDLIFVYMVGRNNSLLHHVDGGFFSAGTFLTFAVATLAIIQIWNFTMFYINLFGRNSLRDHISLFVNMFLLYFMGQGTSNDWTAFQTQYHIAWGLILVNIGVQYLIEMRNHKIDLWNRDTIKKMVITLFVEAALVLIAAIPIPVIGVIFSALAIVFGMASVFLSRSKGPGILVDFAHLTERAMLYVVFTFGEMIIVIAAYFNNNGTLDIGTIYFAAMAFLIVVGLFLSYEIVYDHLIDRERNDDGLIYMLIHVFMIFALNCVTIALEFMHDSGVSLVPKVIFLILAMIGYYAFLFMTGRYAKSRCRFDKTFLIEMLGLAIGFAVLMIILRDQMYLNILVTVLYVFAIFGILYRAKKRIQYFESNSL